MRSRSTLWKELASGGGFRLETVAEIEGVRYSSISAPVINRALFSDALSIGNCVSATLQFSLLTNDPVPKSAKIVIKHRLSNGTRHSEWLSAGTFFVSKRTSDAVSGLLTFQCFDSMLKANASFTVTRENESEFPKQMTDFISAAAKLIGVEVDVRTWDYIQIGSEYVVPLPMGVTIKKILGYIAGIHGGNFIITPENKLRFVPLLSSTDANNTRENERVEVMGILGKLNTGTALVVSGVSMKNGGNTFFSGSDNGFVVNAGVNPYATQQICDTVFSQLNGLVYNPYAIEKGVYDPAAELGDYVISKDDVRGVLCSETATLNLAFRGDISAPFKAEMEDEYPYTSITAELDDELRELISVVADKASIDDLYAVYAMIENLSVSDIKTGIIHSNDYMFGPLPYFYPSDSGYPSDNTYSSNGEVVLRGFAIDFSTGSIYGAFYSEQIAALQDAVSEINTWRELFETEIVENFLALNTTVSGNRQAVNALSNKATLHEEALSDVSQRLSAIQESLLNLQGDISALQNSLTYPKS